MSNTTSKMKVEIWSDIMCPFCYIGKRNLESALEEFPDAENVEVEWHSFQLDPGIESGHGKNLYQYLSERKGLSLEQSIHMHQQVTERARRAGLEYNFDKAVVANSFDAHRVIQLAKSKGLGDAAEERLFYAYFTEGKDFSDHETLVQLGINIGLDEAETRQVLTGNAYADKVEQDISEAQHIGIRGVPFFVFDRKYAVSGAQPVDVFVNTLQQSFTEWQKNNPAVNLEITAGAVCTPGEECK
ncbi:MAG TPA: DsbA family oxidoreductase [Agriterribacter sp.]|nr:DsbA family oxidoreductase [Agriterribacter sp.]